MTKQSQQETLNLPKQLCRCKVSLLKSNLATEIKTNSLTFPSRHATASFEKTLILTKRRSNHFQKVDSCHLTVK